MATLETGLLIGNERELMRQKPSYQTNFLGHPPFQVLPCLVFLFLFSVHVFVSPVFADTDSQKTVKVGILAKRGHQHAFETWNATAAYLTDAIPGRNFQIVPLDFETVRVAAISRDIDFLITNSSYYVALELDYGLSRVATMENLHGDHIEHVFGGVIFTRVNRSDINTLKDLYEKSILAVDRDSLGGWLAAWRELHAEHIRPEHDFRALQFAGTHDAVVLGVINGDADVGIVRTDTLERMADEGKINLADIKILNQQTWNHECGYLLSTRLYPEWPFAILPHTSQQLAKAVAVALLNMPASSDAAKKARIGGWTVPLDYQPIHDLQKELQLFRYKQHNGKISIADFLREHRLTVLMLMTILSLLIFVVCYTILLNRRLERRVEEKTAELSLEATERKITEEKLHRAEKMEAIGLMASGVAHDLNNILSGIVSYPELLLMRLPEKSQLRQPIMAILESGLRAADVVADLLTVARDAAKVRTRVNVNSLILEYLSSPEAEKISSLHPEVTISTALCSSLKFVCCSPSHVSKCIMNLVLNAAEAIDTSGEIIVSTENCHLSAAEAEEISVKPGSYVTITVADNGSGIEPADLQHIFEPFYSKKKMGRSGTGIGLAVVWNSMQDHDGTVIVKSDAKGTVFTLYFPQYEDDCLNTEEDEKFLPLEVAPNLSGNGELILVVDDEAYQRDIAERILKQLGYQVHTVNSGEEAVQYTREKNVDLLLLDMLMPPGMDGLETYKQIDRFKPGQKALIVSGFSEKAKVEQALSMGVESFLKKPYTLRQLSVTVKQALKPKGVEDPMIPPFKGDPPQI
ncbi:PhnD/SsuA/transferrin family substrate-binding protein [uncultured Desulfuromusa sp.]|uniref:PhnD/SsuA/transferrin family substrate-binding protein n=1 Tax=uncultured Desulfuromusa sp. TaxID=219183 RepID=UPI002AA877EA|nr:PhnD/SsuA/transferrin family substrate-binding protein [uncultured Desulfuromusa sp.]